MLVAVDGKLAGLVAVSDPIKPTPVKLWHCYRMACESSCSPVTIVPRLKPSPKN